MSRLLAPTGCLMIIGAIAFIVMGVFATSHPIIAGPVEAIACTDAETLRIDTQNWSLPNGESGVNISFFCDIEPDVGRNVNDVATLYQIGVVVVLMFVGFILILRGLVRSSLGTDGDAVKAQLQAQLAGRGDSTVNYTAVENQLQQMPPETRAILDTVLNNIVTNVATQPDSDITLVDRLEQLKQAYEKGLINREEYDKVRQAILDSMDD